MIASSWWKVGLGMVGAAGIFASSGAGCSSEPSGSGGSSGGDTTSSGSGGGTGGGGTGGDSTTTGSATTTSSGTTTGSGTTTTTGGGSSTSSTGTGSNYVDCQACTDDTAGAPTKECNTAHDACFGNKNCVQIYNCAYDPGTGCSTDAAGACCTYACFDALKATLPNDPAAAQLAIDQYKAYDGCLYCTTCKAQCSADAYCTAFGMGPAGCVN
jgi:hypothetical protein